MKVQIVTWYCTLVKYVSFKQRIIYYIEEGTNSYNYLDLAWWCQHVREADICVSVANTIIDATATFEKISTILLVMFAIIYILMFYAYNHDMFSFIWFTYWL